MKRLLANLKALPIVGRHLGALSRWINGVCIMRRQRFFVPPGHFYSPLPDPDGARTAAEEAFAKPDATLAGIDLNETGQFRLLETLRAYYADLPFPEKKESGFRYYFENPAYSYSDGFFLYAMMRHYRPKRITEVGSGHSSCVMLDTNEHYFDGAMDCTFIEPFPDLLKSVAGAPDDGAYRLLPMRLQDVGLEAFSRLEANDILFIDSSHVARTGSDVNRIFFDILPNVRSGVLIHFHDIFFPFEYPPEWAAEGRAWNEAYLLRAFLEYNKTFEILLFNTFLERFHRTYFERHLPLCLRNTGGSIWLRKK